MPKTNTRTPAIEPDARLLARIATSADQAAMAELDARHSKTLYAITYSVLFDPDAAEAAVAAVFREVWRSARAFDAKRRSVQHWLVELARKMATAGTFLNSPSHPRWIENTQSSREPSGW